MNWLVEFFGMSSNGSESPRKDCQNPGRLLDQLARPVRWCGLLRHPHQMKWPCDRKGKEKTFCEPTPTKRKGLFAGDKKTQTKARQYLMSEGAKYAQSLAVGCKKNYGVLVCA